MEFELKNEGSISFEEEESSELDDDVESQISTLMRFDVVRRPTERYIPTDFYFAFVLYGINDEPISVKNIVNYEEGKL